MYHLSKIDHHVKSIIGATYPEYKGRKVKISAQIPSRLESYWDGGSKEYYVFYDLKTKKTFQVNSNHPLFESRNPRKLEVLPPGVLIVNRTYFCGKDLGITIYANQDDIAPLLPEKTEISDNEKTVLSYTSRYKNTYGGRKHIRFREAAYSTGISREDWVQAQQDLMKKGLLRKNKSITPDGRNALNEPY